MQELYVYFFYKDGQLIVEADDHKRTTGNRQQMNSKQAKFKGEEGDLVHFSDGLFEWNDKKRAFIRRH